MKNTYFIITHKLNGKYCAEVLKVGAGVNIVGYVKDCKTIYSLTVCESKKESENLASFWNECYKMNNTYALICNGKIYS